MAGLYDQVNKKHGTLDHMSNYRPKLLYYGKTTAAPPFQPDDGSKTQTSKRSIFIILQFRAYIVKLGDGQSTVQKNKFTQLLSNVSSSVFPDTRFI
jgi:hypothetical protein